MATPAYFDRYENIRISRRDGIIEVALHTNGGPLQWSGQVSAQLSDAFTSIAGDDANRVMILTGTGDAFTPRREQPIAHRFTADTWHEAWRRGVALQMTLVDIPIPVVGAINGPAHLHAELVLLSDIVIASDTTVISDSPHLESGMVPGDGMHVVMPLLAGRIRAGYVLLAAQSLTADQAKEAGLVNEVVPQVEVSRRAWAIAEGMSRYSTMQLRFTRLLLAQNVRKLLAEQLGYGLALEGLAALSYFGSEDG